MGWFCKLFGHAAPKEGWWGDGLYARITGGGMDGVGRTHYQAWLTCPRCDKEHCVARFHGSQIKDNR